MAGGSGGAWLRGRRGEVWSSSWSWWPACRVRSAAGYSWASSRPTCRWYTASVVATPITAHTAATSATTATSSRVRSDQPAGPRRRRTARSVGGLEDIPRSAQRVDHRCAAGVDLLAEVRDVELDDVGLPAEVVVPDAVEDLRLAQHPARVAHEEAQQLVLGRGQGDDLAVPAHLVAVLVEGEVADGEDGVVGTGEGAGPAQQAAQPGHHLLQAERLGDVVVPARGEPGDAVLDGVLRGA